MRRSRGRGMGWVAALAILLHGCGEPGDAPEVDRPAAEGEVAPGDSAEPGASGGSAEPDSSPAVSAEYLDQVAGLADEPAVVEAFRVIEELEPRTAEDLVTLTEIPAPPFMEDERAEVYADMLREAGADEVRHDEEGNVIAVRRGATGGSAVVISGHLDTVFPAGTDVTVRFDGDTLRAPGVGDDSRGLVVVLTVLRAMEAAGIRTEADLWFVGTVGEEGLGDLRGMKQLFAEPEVPIQAFISVDGGSDEVIVNQALGSRRYRVAFEGPGGHSWSDFGMANPAHVLGEAIAAFDSAAAAYVSEGPRTSYNVGRIGGGTSVNAVPYEAWMEVDMRSIDPERLDGIDQLFLRTMERFGDEEEITRDVEQIGDRPSGEIPSDEPFVQRAMAVVRHFGMEPELRRSSTDSNVPISLGVPAVTVSRGGSGDGAHSLDEWWVNEDGHLAIQRALLLVVAEAGLVEG